ncbi:MAG: hypothetical protein SFU98_06140 [Leptospiraceae bacterium]|nr:hypothetical protein [Leptospiraceae bacterium]
MKIVVFFISIILFLISLGTHVASKFRIVLPEAFYSIHFFAILLFASGLFLKLFQNKSKEKNGVFEGIPPIFTTFGGILVLYAVFNFFSSLGSVGNGVPHVVENGKFYISGRNVPKREITMEEYIDLKSKISSGFSGHWLLFLYVSVLLWYPVKENQKPEDT